MQEPATAAHQQTQSNRYQKPASPEPPSTDYSLPEAIPHPSTGAALAAIAPNLKQGALRLAVFLAGLTEHRPKHTIQITTRELSEITGLVPSALNRAIKSLCEPKRNYVTLRRGNTRKANAYMCNFLATVRSASFGEALPKEANGKNAPQPLLFEKFSASFGEALPTDSNQLTFPEARVDATPIQITDLDRVLRSKPGDHDKATLLTFRRYLHQYMQKLGRDGTNQPNRQAHPPDDNIVAQFLAIAEPHRLGSLLSDLMNERQTAQNYAWFITTGLQRIHGIHFQKVRAARESLKLLKRGERTAAPAAQQSGLDFAANLLSRATAGAKTIR